MTREVGKLIHRKSTGTLPPNSVIEVFFSPLLELPLSTCMHHRTCLRKDREPVTQVCLEHREDTEFSVSNLRPCCCAQKAPKEHRNTHPWVPPRLYLCRYRQTEILSISPKTRKIFPSEAADFEYDIHMGFIENDDFMWIPLKEQEAFEKTFSFI